MTPPRSMYRATLLSLALLAACGPDGDPVSAEARRQAARARIQGFATELQSTLQSAMQNGGPVAAIAVCSGTPLSWSP